MCSEISITMWVTVCPKLPIVLQFHPLSRVFQVSSFFTMFSNFSCIEMRLWLITALSSSFCYDLLFLILVIWIISVFLLVSIAKGLSFFVDLLKAPTFGFINSIIFFLLLAWGLVYSSFSKVLRWKVSLFSWERPFSSHRHLQL